MLRYLVNLKAANFPNVCPHLLIVLHAAEEGVVMNDLRPASVPSDVYVDGVVFTAKIPPVENAIYPVPVPLPSRHRRRQYRIR